jgi:hypothetical protein
VIDWTEERIAAFEQDAQRLAAEGNVWAIQQLMVLSECETLDDKAAVLTRFTEALAEQTPALAAQVEQVALALANTLGPVLRETVQQLVPVVEGLHASFGRAYRGAGMPYGETDDGMQRWLSEMSAAAAARERDYHERLREWAAVDFHHHIETGQHLPPLSVTR